jgi:hypothetical protein
MKRTWREVEGEETERESISRRRMEEGIEENIKVDEKDTEKEME